MTVPGRALLAAAAVGVQVGAAIAASRAVVHEVGPVSLAFLRYAIALATLLPFVLAGGAGWRALRLPWRDALAAAGLGVLQFGVLIALLNEGLRRVDAGLGALLFSTFPVLTLALAMALGRERFELRLAAAVALSIAGIAVALGVRAPSDVGAEFALGATQVLGAALCGAACAVLYRPLLVRHPMLPTGTLAMAAAVLALGAAALGEGLPRRLPAFDGRIWAAIAFVGLSSGIGYWLWLWALKHAPPTRASLFLALSPVTAAAIGFVALGEPLRLGFVLGTAAVLAALGLAAKRQ
ncbi:MAG TPA: DMT family transporter [Burkholderiaceae bacterium]|nr:DMT family transporter [Burkholderiaceae bacterium]